MKKIEVKILKSESIDQAEKFMICAARLTQRRHQTSCLDDFMNSGVEEFVIPYDLILSLNKYP